MSICVITKESRHEREENLGFVQDAGKEKLMVCMPCVPSADVIIKPEPMVLIMGKKELKMAFAIGAGSL